MNIILLGPQGSGKGTQAQRLTAKYGFKHISTGDLIRQGIADKDETAMKIKEIYDKGELVPDKLIMELVKKNLGQGNIFDGIPRTLSQAEALDEVTKIDLVIELKMSDEIGLERLGGRKQCKNCSTIFGKVNPPKEENKCDKCGGELYQRDDDKPEAIRKRLAIYREETEPLLEYYKPRDIVKTVDASKTIEEIFNDLVGIIDTAGEQTQ